MSKLVGMVDHVKRLNVTALSAGARCFLDDVPKLPHKINGSV